MEVCSANDLELNVPIAKIPEHQKLSSKQLLNTTNMETTTKKKSVYSIINDNVLEKVRQNAHSWLQPIVEPPVNLATKEPYSGINHIMLNGLGYKRNYFVTFKQARALGGNVKRGEQGHYIVALLESKKVNPDNGIMENKRALKLFRVFNVEQCENLSPHLVPPLWNKNRNPEMEGDKIISRMQRDSRFDKNGDLYMPKREEFANVKDYYDACFKQLVHYKMEKLERGESTLPQKEFIAEMSLGLLKARAGFTPEIQSKWDYERLKNATEKDPQFIIHASSRAHKVNDQILDTEKTKEAPTNPFKESQETMNRKDELEEVRKNADREQSQEMER